MELGGRGGAALTMVSSRLPARLPPALARERAAGRPTAVPASRKGPRRAAGGGRLAGRVRPVGRAPPGRGSAGGVVSSRSPPGPSTCGRRRALRALSETLPAFLDRLWGPWLVTRTSPLRGPAAASPSKVASPSALPRQLRFL